MTKTQAIEDDAKDEVITTLIASSWQDLKAIEYQGSVFFPETLKKRKANGNFEEVQVMLKVPRKHEERQARLKARQWAEADGVDPKLDPDVFDDMDSTCLLWLAIRNTSAPHEPFYGTPQEVERFFDDSVLTLTMEKLQILKKKIDPRIDHMNVEELFAVIQAIAARRDVSPLVVYDSDSQANFIVSMVGLLENLVTPKLLSEALGLSIQDASPPPDSSTSSEAAP
jgi:hypothetical protein